MKPKNVLLIVALLALLTLTALLVFAQTQAQKRSAVISPDRIVGIIPEPSTSRTVGRYWIMELRDMNSYHICRFEPETGRAWIYIGSGGAGEAVSGEWLPIIEVGK